MFDMAQNSFVAKCSCKHEGQDKIYGDGNRLFNEYNVIIDSEAVLSKT